MCIRDSVYDALISTRIYKSAFSHEQSIEIMVAERGAHFDPDILDAMVSIADTFNDIAGQYRDNSTKIFPASLTAYRAIKSVSYTHLDVYKRQD